MELTYGRYGNKPYYIELAEKMTCNITEELLDELDAIDELCIMAGGRLVSRQAVAQIVYKNLKIKD